MRGGSSFAGFARLADASAKYVRAVARTIGDRMWTSAYCISKCNEKMNQHPHRVGLRVRFDASHHVTGKTVERGFIWWLREVIFALDLDIGIGSTTERIKRI